jgi:hypothetical protein
LRNHEPEENSAKHQDSRMWRPEGKCNDRRDGNKIKRRHQDVKTGLSRT